MLTTPELIAHITRYQCGYKAQSTAADLRDGGGDLANLVAEKKAQADETTSVNRGAKRIEEEKTARADLGHAGERRDHGAKAGEKFCDEHTAHAVVGINILGAANTGVRLKCYAAKETQDPAATVTPEIKPHGVRRRAGEH